MFLTVLELEFDMTILVRRRLAQIMAVAFFLMTPAGLLLPLFVDSTGWTLGLFLGGLTLGWIGGKLVEGLPEYMGSASVVDDGWLDLAEEWSDENKRLSYEMETGTGWYSGLNNPWRDD